MVINYPFIIITPKNYTGYCLDITDGVLKILPCDNKLSQRFQISTSRVLGECPVINIQREAQ